MELANRWADGDNAICNERGHSLVDEDDGNRSSERRRKWKNRPYEQGENSENVAAGFTRNQDEGFRGNREWKKWERPEEKPVNEQFEEYCPMHLYEDKEKGKFKSTHLLKHCQKF